MGALRLKKIGYKRFLGIVTVVLLMIVMFVYCISLLFPLFWMLITSFKDGVEYYLDAFGLPDVWRFQNYKEALGMLQVSVTTSRGTVIYDVWNMLGTSFLWAFGNSFLNILLTTMVAYVISRYNFFGKKFLYGLGIFVMITPIIGSLPSAMLTRKQLGIHDNIFLMMVTNPSTVFSGLYFLLLYAAFKRIPWSYAEAVFIDGGGHFRVFFSIMLPMMFPTIMALFLLTFLGVWNDYTSFLIWLPSYANLALGIFRFQDDAATYEATMPHIMAGFVIIIIPTVTLYLCSQRLILSKFSVGGLKG